MNRDSVEWRGYMPAITTPFDERGDLDLKRLRNLLEWLAEEGMHGLIVAGTTGEWFSMAQEEKARLFGTVGEVLKGVMPLIGGCNFLDVMRALNQKVRIFGVPMTETGDELVLSNEADGTMGAGAVLGRL